MWDGYYISDLDFKNMDLIYYVYAIFINMALIICLDNIYKCGPDL